MSEKEDIRWIQRFDSFNNAFSQLEAAVKLSRTRRLSELERQGLVQAFEFTHELAWKTIKDFFEFRGVSGIYGSKDAVREAFSFGIISEGESWMNMIQSRNESTHTYNEKTAEKIFSDIVNTYYSAFKTFKKTMSKLRDEEF